MRWQGREGSKNVEDRRGSSTTARAVGGIGIGTIIFAVIALLMGGNPMQILNNVLSQRQSSPAANTAPVDQQADDELAQFVSVVLADTEQIWTKLFREQLGKQYREPKLVLYRGQVQSACGFNTAASGPFYCPGDEKLYIDLSFYQELRDKFRAPGDFAMAYVIAHEVGHHVQNLLGITKGMQQQRGRISETAYNDLSVRLELQADFLAGVWTHHDQQLNNILEEGDVEEAMRAAHAIGDDNIQKRSRGYVVPESFTHGTSEQRMRWFRKGLQTGDLSQGDTFSATNL